MSSASGGATSDNQADIADLLQRATISIIHEATLQDLLRCSNDAVHRLLLERNTLLQEREYSALSRPRRNLTGIYLKCLSRRGWLCLLRCRLLNPPPCYTS